MRPLMSRIYLFAALAAVGTTACAIPEMIEARDHIREGNALYSDGAYQEAVEAYDASLAIEEDGVTVLWNRACAAESVVLHHKDAAEDEPEKLAARKKYAQIALDDFSEWHTRLEAATAEDDKALNDHRLAVLSADARCNDLVDYWTEKHRADPKEEGLYTVIARTWEDTCADSEKSDEWYVKRTKDFPGSAKAFYSLAVRRFGPLFPDPESGLPYNQVIDPGTRMKFANEVIELLKRATEIEPNYRDPYVWRSMAYNQRMFARQYAEPAEMAEDKLEAIAAREDSMFAWKETKAVCDIDSIPNCAMSVGPGDFAPKVLGALSGKEISLRGTVVEGSVKILDAAAHRYEFGFTVLPMSPSAGVPGGKDDDKKTQTIIKVEYTFMIPEVEEGEDAVDLTEHIADITESWKKGNEFFTGTLDPVGDLLRVEEKPPAGCCPPAPLSDEEIAIDKARVIELKAQVAATDAAEARRKKRGRRGR